MIVTLLATNIQYDIDGPGVPTMEDLPKSMEVQVDLKDQIGWPCINAQVCNQVSDATGMLVLDYHLIGLYRLKSFKSENTARKGA